MIFEEHGALSVTELSPGMRSCRLSERDRSEVIHKMPKMFTDFARRGGSARLTTERRRSESPLSEIGDWAPRYYVLPFFTSGRAKRPGTLPALEIS